MITKGNDTKVQNEVIAQTITDETAKRLKLARLFPKQEIKEGGLVQKPEFPSTYYNELTNSSYVFSGWYSDPSLDIKYVWNFETDRVYNNITLYAKCDEIKN